MHGNVAIIELGDGEAEGSEVRQRLKVTHKSVDFVIRRTVCITTNKKEEYICGKGIGTIKNQSWDMLDLRSL
jgi:hypothetical protein